VWRRGKEGDNIKFLPIPIVPMRRTLPRVKEQIPEAFAIL